MRTMRKKWKTELEGRIWTPWKVENSSKVDLRCPDSGQCLFSSRKCQISGLGIVAYPDKTRTNQNWDLLHQIWFHLGSTGLFLVYSGSHWKCMVQAMDLCARCFKVWHDWVLSGMILESLVICKDHQIIVPLVATTIFTCSSLAYILASVSLSSKLTCIQRLPAYSGATFVFTCNSHVSIKSVVFSL